MELVDKIGNAKSLLENFSTESQPYKKPSNVTSRRFFIRSYINPAILDSFLRTSAFIHHWSYCVHDKDVNDKGEPKTSHTHIALYTYSQKTSSAIEKIFNRLDVKTRIEGAQPEKTEVEIMADTTSAWRYLRHLDNPEKHQYTDSERVCDNGDWWSHYERTDGMNDSSDNRALAMFDDKLNGMNARDFYEKYGRDGMMNHARIKADVLTYRIETETAKGIPFDRQLLDVILSSSNFSRQDIAMFNTVLAYVQRSCTETYGSPIDFYFREDKENA